MSTDGAPGTLGSVGSYGTTSAAIAISSFAIRIIWVIPAGARKEDMTKRSVESILATFYHWNMRDGKDIWEFVRSFLLNNRMHMWLVPLKLSLANPSRVSDDTSVASRGLAWVRSDCPNMAEIARRAFRWLFIAP
jgi:hypothetical protein